jgi:hypothetical protein
VLYNQADFLMHIVMQRHTSIFTSRMVAGLTQTQFAALAKLYEAGPCSQNCGHARLSDHGRAASDCKAAAKAWVTAG